MIILHAGAILWGKHSGPSASVPGLVTAQNAIEGVHAALIPTIDGDADPPCDPCVPVFHRRALLGTPGKIDLPAPFDRPDMVVFHSTYVPTHARIARRLHRAGIPYLICPRGGMTRDALGRSWLKKQIGNVLFFNGLTSNAAALHCLTEGEAGQSLGWHRPTFVVGNGIPLPARFNLANIGQGGHPRLVFMGRLDIFHKGLDLLLDACSIIHRDLADAAAHIALHGPDWDGGVRKLRDRIARLGLDGLVSVEPPVSGRAKTMLLKQTDFFLHTSRFEGLPMAVLEALAHGVPCLLTAATNMADEVAECGAGWKIEATPEGIAAGIKRVLSDDRDTWAKTGRNARRLIEQHYGWDIIGPRSVEAYRRFAA